MVAGSAIPPGIRKLIRAPKLPQSGSRALERHKMPYYPGASCSRWNRSERFQRWFTTSVGLSNRSVTEMSAAPVSLSPASPSAAVGVGWRARHVLMNCR